VNITHPFVDDLILRLTSPEGTTVVLSSRNGGSGENYIQTLFDNDAEVLISDGEAPFTGSFIPEGDLDNFTGENSIGAWTLNVSDNAFIDSGRLENWSLELCSQELLSVSTYDRERDFNIYPNPNNGEFTILMNKVQNSQIGIEIYDLNGRKVYNQEFQATSSFKKAINLNNLQSGVYLVKIKDGANTGIKKLVVN
jgi:subtilisin-like proprotein convertase family protein